MAGTRLFRGWYVVGGSFLSLFIGFGIVQSFGVFFTPLADTFHTTRAETSLVYSFTGFLYFALSAVTGRIADRIGPRPLVLAGAMMIAGGLLLAGRATALWQVYVAYSIGVGVGVACLYVPGVGAVQRWFMRRRGFATGLAVAGTGAGQLAGPPFAALLIRGAGWRATYSVFGLVALTVLAGAALLMEQSPEARGLRPDGALAGPLSEDDAAEGQSARQALRSRLFWLIYSADFLSSLALFIPFVHLAPYAQGQGVSEIGAANLLSLIGLGSVSGRLLLSPISDRLGRRPSLAAMFGGMGLMMAWWLLAHSLWSLAIFAVGFGVCYGGFVALLPSITADYFGAGRVGAIIGLLYTSAAVGNLIGPPLAGRAYDVSASYTLPILFGVAVNALAFGCILLLPDSRRESALRLSAAD